MDLLHAAQKKLKSERKVDNLDLGSASHSLSFEGYLIKDATCQLSDLPRAKAIKQKGDALHFSVEKRTPPPQPDLCYFCSLMWRRKNVDEEFIIFKLSPNAFCYEILQLLHERRVDFD